MYSKTVKKKRKWKSDYKNPFVFVHHRYKLTEALFQLPNCKFKYMHVYNVNIWSTRNKWTITASNANDLLIFVSIKNVFEKEQDYVNISW